MTLREILRIKGSKVSTIRPQATLDEVVQNLVHHNIGSLVVCEDDDPREMIGIITERDILRATAARQKPLEQLQVADCMSEELITGAYNDTVPEIMGLMTEHRVRHLPVMDDGALVGIISIGDVVKAQHDALTMENHYLKNYIHGEVDETSTFALFSRHAPR
ncbi:MAG TPA: CBS domain-containing protein [Pirellulales bacterium]|nr:CBS domain-containing protein [Pirellulales bacterium]